MARPYDRAAYQAGVKTPPLNGNDFWGRAPINNIMAPVIGTPNTPLVDLFGAGVQSGVTVRTSMRGITSLEHRNFDRGREKLTPLPDAASGTAYNVERDHDGDPQSVDPTTDDMP